MSVSGSGGVGASWVSPEPEETASDQPATESEAHSEAAVSRAPTSEPAAATDPHAEALLHRLNETARTTEAWLPGWLEWLDDDSNVKDLATRALRDGRVTGQEVEDLVRGAHDWGEMQPAEREALGRLVTDHASSFEASARVALCSFLGIADPLGDQGPTGRPIDLNLPKVAGRSFGVHPQGYPVELGAADGPPGLRGEGAERIYRGGKALVEAPPGVLRGVPAEVQERMLESASAWYDQGLAEVASSPISPTDAHKVRSGAAATLLALVEGGKTPAIRDQAAKALIERAGKEPMEGLRANIYVNLEAHEKELSPTLRSELGLLKEKVLPAKPPYDKWFPTGNETFEVVHYLHPDHWERGLPDPFEAYREIGMEVTSHHTNEHGEEEWILEGNVKGADGAEQPTRARLIKTHDEFTRDLDDPNVHAVFYTGHSNLGGNVSEAVKHGPDMNGDKLLYFKVCRGVQNLYEVANKYPNAHILTTRDKTPSSTRVDGVIGVLSGVARRDSYEGIRSGTGLGRGYERNLVIPDELQRFEYTDMDFDGEPELGLDARDRFFDVLTREPDLVKTDLSPRTELRAASEIDATAVMNGINFARTLVSYHTKHGASNSPFRGVKGDRIEADGFFEGSDDAIRVTETTGRDGKPVYNVAVNKAFADQSAYAIGALVQFELTRHFAEKDGSFSKEEKARAILMTGEYLSYMYASNRESNAITRAIGKRAGIDNLRFNTVYEAIEADDSGYATDGQVDALLDLVRIT
ncbi:hypothetical protein ACFL59_07695 [Planctomycetota bacterium]